MISQGYTITGVGKIYHKGSSSPGHDGKSWSIPHAIPKNYPPQYGEPAMGHYQAPAVKQRISELEAAAGKKGVEGQGKIRNYVLEQCKPSTEAADLPDLDYPETFVPNDDSEDTIS